MSKKSAIILIIFFMLFLMGCRYTFTTFLPADVKSLYITQVDIENPVELPVHLNASEVLLEQIRDNFIDDNRLRLVDRKNADSILRVSIIEYTDIEEPLEGEFSRKMQVVVKAYFQDLRTGKTIWKDNELKYEARYSFNPDEDNREDGEKMAFSLIAVDAAKDLLQQVVYGW